MTDFNEAIQAWICKRQKMDQEKSAEQLTETILAKVAERLDETSKEVKIPGKIVFDFKSNGDIVVSALYDEVTMWREKWRVLNSKKRKLICENVEKKFGEFPDLIVGKKNGECEQYYYTELIIYVKKEE